METEDKRGWYSGKSFSRLRTDTLADTNEQRRRLSRGPATALASSLLAALVFCVGCGGPQAPEAASGSESGGTVALADQPRTSVAPSVLFFGDSITAGYQLDVSNAFPALIAAKIEEAGFHADVKNAGNSGETSAGGLRRITWFMDDPVDIFVLELGANDGLRGVPVPQIRSNLQAIIDTVRSANPQVEVVIAGMQIPPNMGQTYAREFRALFPELARENDAVLIPFLLADVAGEESLNLYDRIHPNVEGHRIIAETVWTYLEPVLHELAGG